MSDALGPASCAGILRRLRRKLQITDAPYKEIVKEFELHFTEDARETFKAQIRKPEHGRI